MAKVPPRYAAAELSDFSLARQGKILEWLAAPGDGLFITGKSGTGKTYLAAALVRSLTLERRSAFFRRCSRFYQALRDCYVQQIPESQVLDEYSMGDFVVLDDLGAGSLSDFERRSILEVLDQRLNKMQPTIVTTNFTIIEIAEKMDNRIADRLGAFRKIELVGDSERVRKE